MPALLACRDLRAQANSNDWRKSDFPAETSGFSIRNGSIIHVRETLPSRYGANVKAGFAPRGASDKFKGKETSSCDLLC
jgi:hypothetical protein